MDFFRKLTQQLRQIWNGMARSQKIATVIATVGAVTILGAAVYWGSQTEYQVLSVGMSAEEAAFLTNKLQDKGVSYKLAAGGTSVLVPADQVQQLRVGMVADEFQSKSGPGFGILDQTTFGWSPFLQHVNYLRGLQGELAKSIMQIDPVVYARVLISRPEPSPFVRDQKPTTASVMLKLRPGTTLSRNVCAGIVALVSRSVEGLSRENVVVVDSSGRELSGSGNGEAGGAGGQIEQRRDLETYLGKKAEDMLGQVLGPGRAVVRVTADVNIKNLREKKEIYLPDGRVAVSESVSTNKSTTNGMSKAGPAGTTSNLGKASSSAGQATGSDSQDEVLKTEYLVSKTTQETEDRLGTIERITVAALVDLSRPAESSSGTPETAMSLADVQDIIKKAVGFKTDRDEIKVIQVRMPDVTSVSSAIDEEWAKQQQWQQILSVVRNSSLGVTALAGVLLAWILLRKRSAAANSADWARPPGAEDNVNLERIASVLERNPQAVGKVLLNWLNEPEEATRKAA